MRSDRTIAIGAAALLGGVALVVAVREAPRSSETASSKHEASPSLEALPPDVAVQRLGELREPALRRQLVRAIARAPEPAAKLRAVWKGSSDSAAREEALIQAAKAGGPDSARWLAEVASTDEKLGARAGAALGTMRSREAAPELARIAASDAPVIARANAAQALGRSGSASDSVLLAKLAADAAQPLRVRQEAALGLARIGQPSDVPALSAALAAAADDGSQGAEQLRITLVRALARIGTVEARDALRRHDARALSANERAFMAAALARR